LPERPKLSRRKQRDYSPAKFAKLGEIKIGAVKKKMVGWSGAFASLAPWRDKNPRITARAKAQSELSRRRVGEKVDFPKVEAGSAVDDLRAVS
jgi:hypothetical protein